MMKFSKLDAVGFCSLISLSCGFIAFSISLNAPPLLVAALALWGAIMAYALRDIKNRIALAFFLVAFFTLLIGQDACIAYLGMPASYKYLLPANNFAYLCVIVALAGVWSGYQWKKRSPVRIYLPFEKVGYSGRFRQFCAIMMATCFAASVVCVVIKILFVRDVGYVDSYSASLGGAGVPAVLAYIGAFFSMSLFLYLSTKPKRSRALLVLGMYELYGILTLFTGQRYPFVGINMMILLYIVLRSRDERGWISRKFIILVICAAPFLIIFLSMYSSIRAGRESEYKNGMEALLGFFYSQGISLNVVKEVKYYAAQLNDLKLCSFSHVRSTLLENVIIRHIANIKVYSGNSIETALYGHSLAHRLSYYTYGNAYLMGRGIGSSYVAELYHDFGYMGVFLGSAVYGYILRAVSDLSFRSPFQDAILLSMTYALFFAPRAEFDLFINSFFTLYSLLGLAFVYFFYLAFRRKLSKRAAFGVGGYP